MNVNRTREDFTRGSSGFLSVSPSGLFGRIVWPNCHVFRNVKSFINVVKNVSFDDDIRR